MKIQHLFLILFASTLLISCDKASDVLKLSSMEASIDGTSWKAMGTIIASHTSETFTIAGTSLGGQAISFVILGDTEGTYRLSASISNPEANVSGFYKPDATTADQDIYVITEATVDLDDVNSTDKKISGTFDFKVTKFNGTTVVETLEITDGEFNSVDYLEN